VKGINGSFSNVVGLPVERLRKELAIWKDSHNDPDARPKLKADFP
jgi:hypothetical protein